MRLAGLLSHALMVIRETVRHQRLHSPNVDTLDIREEKLIDLLLSKALCQQHAQLSSKAQTRPTCVLTQAPMFAFLSLIILSLLLMVRLVTKAQRQGFLSKT